MGPGGLAAHQKKASRRQAWLAFLDESGLMMAPLMRRTWNPRGETPLLRHCGGTHRKVSVIGALCVAPMVLIRDRLNAHRAYLVQDSLAAHRQIATEFFPPYAPELNAMEHA